jgi:hypothetical protein
LKAEDRCRYKKFLYKRQFREDESKITAAAKTARENTAAKLRKAWKES